jgi:hypothetical protein
VQMASTAQALQTANARARAAGVTTLPAIQIDGRTYEGSEAMALGGAS